MGANNRPGSNSCVSLHVNISRQTPTHCTCTGPSWLMWVLCEWKECHGTPQKWIHMFWTTEWLWLFMRPRFFEFHVFRARAVRLAGIYGHRAAGSERRRSRPRPVRSSILSSDSSLKILHDQHLQEWSKCSLIKQSRLFSGYATWNTVLSIRETLRFCETAGSKCLSLAHSLLVCSKRAKWWIPCTFVRVNGGASKFLFSRELTDRW